jgi:D-sedoheptulose 7-phosphate isomerase
MNALHVIRNRVDEVSKILPEFVSKCSDDLVNAADLVVTAFKSDFKVLICGNGGSAADSQHLAAEFVNAFSREIQRPALSAIALTVDTSILTAFSNDFGYENVFARQVEAHGRKGDVLIVITTSGSSRNCVSAVMVAKSRGLSTIALTRDGGEINALVDIAIGVPSKNTQHIQECHMIGYHILAELVETSLYGGVQK